MVQLVLEQVQFRAKILFLFLEILQDVPYAVGMSCRPRPSFLRLINVLALYLHSGRFLSEVSVLFKTSSHRGMHLDRIILVISVGGCLHDGKLGIYGRINIDFN